MYRCNTYFDNWQHFIELHGLWFTVVPRTGAKSLWVKSAEKSGRGAPRRCHPTHSDSNSQLTGTKAVHLHSGRVPAKSSQWQCQQHTRWTYVRLVHKSSGWQNGPKGRQISGIQVSSLADDFAQRSTANKSYIGMMRSSEEYCAFWVWFKWNLKQFNLENLSFLWVAIF